MLSSIVRTFFIDIYDLHVPDEELLMKVATKQKIEILTV